MSSEKCIHCGKTTASVIETEEGFVCYLCYTNKKDAAEPAKSKRKISHEEADIQSEFFKVVPTFFPRLPDKLLFAVPNGGSRNAIEAKNLKRQGLKPGISDVILLIPKKGFASLLMEFKTQQGDQSDEQLIFQHQAEACGSKYVIVRSVGQAIDEMKAYLK